MKRREKSAWISIAVAAALVFAFNCGGGGDSDVTSPEYDIIGTYRLTGSTSIFKITTPSITCFLSMRTMRTAFQAP